MSKYLIQLMETKRANILQHFRSIASGFFTATGDVRRKRRMESALLIIALIVIVSSGAFLYSTQEQIQAQSAQYERGQRLERNLLVLMSRLKDVETGARGYALTDDEDYLEPYVKGKTVVVQELANLDRLVEDDPVQRLNIKKISQLSLARFDSASRLIALTQASQ